MPSSAQIGSTTCSGPRHSSAYSLWTAATGSSACARRTVGAPASERPNLRTIEVGCGGVLFLDLALPNDVAPPAELRHRLALSISKNEGGRGGTIQDVVHDPVVAVAREPALVIQLPLRGSAWIAFDSLGGDAHRPSMNPVYGKERIARRFAIDGVKLAADGRLFHGDAASSASFEGYGADVLAVADGRDLRREGQVSRERRPQRSERSSGHAGERSGELRVIEDLATGRFALYAHLQLGRLRVKPGDETKVGAGTGAARQFGQLGRAASALPADGGEFAAWDRRNAVRDPSGSRSSM